MTCESALDPECVLCMRSTFSCFFGATNKLVLFDYPLGEKFPTSTQMCSGAESWTVNNCLKSLVAIIKQVEVLLHIIGSPYHQTAAHLKFSKHTLLFPTSSPQSLASSLLSLLSPTAPPPIFLHFSHCHCSWFSEWEVWIKLSLFFLNQPLESRLKSPNSCLLSFIST